MYSARHVKAMTILAISVLISMSGVSMPTFTTLSTSRAEASSPPVQLDPDGDDPREDTTYHWQLPGFASDEHRQTAGAFAIIVFLAASGAARRAVMRRKLP
jgi:hypothetical protein